MMLFILILIGLGIYYFIKEHNKDKSENYINELKISFARGEISESEYLRKLDILKGSGYNEGNH